MKKKIIQIVVIILAFGGSGYVLYNGFFKNNNQEALQNASPGIIGTAVPGGAQADVGGTAANLPPVANPIAGGDSQNLLPFGDKLDYSVLDKQNLQSAGYTPLPLNYDTDVGIPESNLVMPPPSQGQ